MDNYLEEEKNLAEFISSIKKVHKSRKHKVTKSLGSYDAYKWIRKNKWLNIGRVLTEHEFYSIIREVNKGLADNFLKGYNIKFPNRMGQLELRKYDATFSIKDGKVKTNLPIDWNRTLKLWYEDKEARDNKTLIKSDEKEIYKAYYNKHSANYKNKTFYEFKVNRKLKENIKSEIKDNNLDAYKI